MQVDHIVYIDGVTPEQVWKIVSDTRNDQKWWKSLISTEVISHTKYGLGTRYKQKSKMLGTVVESEIEVIKFDPPDTMTLSNTSGSIPFVATYIVSETPTGASYRMVATVDVGGILRLFAPLVKLILKWQVKSNFKLLKQYMEENVA